MTQPTDAGQTFGCRNCGAKLNYDAATQGMRCPFCGFQEAVQASTGQQAADATREIPIEEGLARAVRGLGAPVQPLGCKDCGATVNVAQNERTAKCSFCGSQQVLAIQPDPNLIRPE